MEGNEIARLLARQAHEYVLSAEGTQGAKGANADAIQTAWLRGVSHGIGMALEKVNQAVFE